MKLIKINTDHYVVVDDSEIKHTDWYLDDTNQIRQCVVLDTDYWKSRKDYKKITHSTQPIEYIKEPSADGIQCAKIYHKIKPLSLQEVKELIWEVDVEDKAKEEYPSIIGTTQTGIGYDMNSREKEAYKKGYYQALEDNKEKKYTEEDLLDAWELGAYVGLPLTRYKKETLFKAVQPKTEWEVCFVDGKLKLK